MRKGNDAHLVFDEHGRLLALATGSDACTEHECGSKPLLSALCEQPAADEVIIGRLKSGKTVRYPRLLESKRITRFPEGLQFIELPASPGKPPEAILGYCPRPLDRYKDELRFSTFISRYNDNDVVGAWCEDSFAIRVRTEKYVTALKGFEQALRKGKVLFAGLFLRRPRVHLSGVILARSDYLTAEDLAAASKAQTEYESKLRLKARDESNAIMREMSQHFGKNHWIGFLSPRWADEAESEVRYWFNPEPALDAGYGGPYSKEELLAWAQAKGSYRLGRSHAA